MGTPSVSAHQAICIVHLREVCIFVSFLFVAIFLLNDIKHEKIQKGWNMLIHLHFLSKSEYQFEEKLIKNVAFSALSKHVPRFPLPSPPPPPPSFKVTIFLDRQESLGEKITQVLLRRTVVLCYDATKCWSICMCFEIFNQQNSNLEGTRNSENCIFMLSAGLH